MTVLQLLPSTFIDEVATMKPARERHVVLHVLRVDDCEWIVPQLAPNG